MSYWLEDYINEVPVVMMRDPFLELLGQVEGSIPYSYGEVVKFSGHSCGAVAGAWMMTVKALAWLYGDEVPVRGRVRVFAPGRPDESTVGVLGEVISYITGAAPESGFPGGGFGREYNRRNLMVYPEVESGLPLHKMVWVFERLDTGEKVGVRYDVSKIEPASTAEWGEMGAKVARGEASEEERRDWVEYWNERARFVLFNGDVPGLFEVEKRQL